MKKSIILAIIAVCAINAPAHSETLRALKNDTSKVVTKTTPTVKRIVKFPIALTSVVLGKTADLLWHNPVVTAWNLSK